MRRSTERILTTHAGSLPRPPEILAITEGRDQREVKADDRITQAIADVVRKQVGVGIDIPSDGEMGRVGFSAYATERLTGFDGERKPMLPFVEPTLFPEYFEEMRAAPATLGFAACNGPITWRGPEFVHRDIEVFTAALSQAGHPVEDAFIPAVSPGQLWLNFQNEYYPSDEQFVMAAADALRNEYRAIVEAGFVLQLDDPGLAMGWHRLNYKDSTYADYRRVVAQHIDAINHAIDGLPANRIRLHVCWGNGEWPHVRDVPLAEIVDELLKVRAEAIYVEGANPRHGHEWSVFAERKLPDDKILIPGVIDTVTNFVEHPDLVAERIVRFASVVGRERVIAGTDCGFGTIARSRPRVHPTIVWAKLESLAEGARRASLQLYSRAA